MFFREYTVGIHLLIEEVTFIAEVGDFSIHSARQVISRTILFAEQVPTIGHRFLHFLLVVKRPLER